MPKWFMIVSAVVLFLLGAASVYVIETSSSLNFTLRDDISRSEFVSIILTALGVILAAMAIMLGALAILGWTSIQSQVEKKSSETTNEYLRDRFSDGNAEYLQFIEDIKEDIRARLIAQFQDDPEDEGEQEDPDQ